LQNEQREECIKKVGSHCPTIKPGNKYEKLTLSLGYFKYSVGLQTGPALASAGPIGSTFAGPHSGP